MKLEALDQLEGATKWTHISEMKSDVRGVVVL